MEELEPMVKKYVSDDTSEESFKNWSNRQTINTQEKVKVNQILMMINDQLLKMASVKALIEYLEESAEGLGVKDAEFRKFGNA